MVMAVPSLRCVCQLRLVEDLVRVRYGNVSLEKTSNDILNQLDQGAWGLESLAILDRAVKYYNHILLPRVILALLPCNTRNLILKECPLLTEETLNTAIERCSSLEHLDVTENAHLNFTHIDILGTVLFEKRKLLTVIILEDCPQINDVHVQNLMLNAPNLQHLNIARCNITDRAFLLNEQRQLAREACFQIDGLTSKFDSKLHTVDVSRCEEFSSTGVRYLCSLCGPTLQNVDLSWTKVDCTALLYLSGMGLPHAVQFYMSANAINSDVLESLVYTLHEFDAICEDIIDNWTSTETEENLGDSENTTNENSAQPTDGMKTCEEIDYSVNVVHIDEIEPVIDGPFDEKYYFVDESVDTSDSSPVCDDKLQTYMDSSASEKLPDSLTDSDSQSRLDCISLQEKCPSSDLSNIDQSSTQEALIKAQNGRVLSSESTSSSQLKNSSDVIENDKCDKLDVKCDINDQEEFDNTDFKNELSKNNKSDDINATCDKTEKQEDGKLNIKREAIDENKFDNMDVNPIKIRDSISSSSTNVPHTLSHDKDLDRNTNHFSAANLKYLPADEQTNGAINDHSSSFSKEKTDKPKLKKSFSSSKVKMDFEPNINCLQINGIIFRDEILGLLCLQTFLKANKNLHSLTLYGGITGNFVTDMIMDLIGYYSHKLTYLSVEGCAQVTNIGLSTIGNSCKQMGTLNFIGIPFLSDFGIIPLLKSLPITHLLLAETQISGLSLDALSEMAHVSELKEIDLSWCEEIDGDASLNKLFKLCPSMTRLMLRETPLTANTLSLIAVNCHNITELSIASNMSNVLDESVIVLSENLPLLETIDLSWNSHLTDKAIHSLFTNCRHLWNADLEGLKIITASALIPIIVVPDELKYFFIKLNENCKENSEEGALKIEALPYLPHRSTTYCTELRYVNLKYSDFVVDANLEELVTVTDGAIKVIDYYGEEVEKSETALENLLKRFLDS